MKTPTCRYHCRACGAHFASLRAFDAHRTGDHEIERVCEFPDDIEFFETVGKCEIADPDKPAPGITIYSLRQEGGYALRGREALQGKRKAGV